MGKSKTKKIFLPIVLFLTLLTVLFISLTVAIKVTGGHSSSKSEKKGKESSEVVDTGESYDNISGYELPDYSSGTTSVVDNTVTDKLANKDGYILPNSDTVALTDADLAGLTAQELSYARNEIYARHGYVFDSQELNSYFSQKSWYKADATFKQEATSAQEQANAEFIKAYQQTNNLTYDVK